MTFKWSVDEKILWKETFDERKLLYFSEKKKPQKTSAISMSNKRKQQHSAIQTRTRLSIKDREVPNNLNVRRNV